MWLIITAFAAIVSTLTWYLKDPKNEYKLGSLSIIFWGATLMWFVDLVMTYISEGGEFLEVNLDATLLGISVVVITLLGWEVSVLISDPKGIIRKR
ncbi:MAG: hypothetical protein ABIN61_02390 [candidate division WOR-3 bacterium]